MTEELRTNRNLHTYIAKKEIYVEIFSTTSQTELDIINPVLCSFFNVNFYYTRKNCCALGAEGFNLENFTCCLFSSFLHIHLVTSKAHVLLNMYVKRVHWD